MKLELFDPAQLELVEEQRAHNVGLIKVTAAMAAIDNRTPEGIRWIREAMEPGGAFGFQSSTSRRPPPATTSTSPCIPRDRTGSSRMPTTRGKMAKRRIVEFLGARLDR